jgi:hypothetical protein
LNRLTKTGLIGLGITTLATLLLFFRACRQAGIANVSFIALAPFYMPWMVLLLIGITNKKTKSNEK